MKKAILFLTAFFVLAGCGQKKIVRYYHTTDTVTVAHCDKQRHVPDCVIPPYPGGDADLKIQAGQIRPPEATHNHGRKSIATTFAPAVGPGKTFRVLVILADFDDQPGTVAPAFFDNLVFGDAKPSVKHCYLENSYGNFDISTLNLPSTTGWLRLPKSYSYYADSAYGLGLYPQNAQLLAEDAVKAADPYVDFSQYDADRNQLVDALIIIHSGTGAELSGQPTDIWSHKTEIPYTAVDGVYARTYCMVPEFWESVRQPRTDMTIGVITHEFSHLLNLPDLYGTQAFAGAALGRWSLMAQGAWNGPLGSSPAHLDAWSKDFLGFSQTKLVHGITDATLPAAEGSPVIYKLQPDRKRPEYWLVENRQKQGYDEFLPGAGLIIYHVDDANLYQSNLYGWWPESPEPLRHWHVAIEEASGKYNLAHCCTGYGSIGDPWPGFYDRHTYNDTTRPASDFYVNEPSGVSVEQISPSGNVMTARVSIRNPLP